MGVYLNSFLILLSYLLKSELSWPGGPIKHAHPVADVRHSLQSHLIMPRYQELTLHSYRRMHVLLDKKKQERLGWYDQRQLCQMLHSPEIRS